MKTVFTEASSYLIDEEKQLMLRVPGNDSSDLYSDKGWIPYLQIIQCRVGLPLEILWELNGQPKLRYSTPVTRIEENHGSGRIN